MKLFQRDEFLSRIQFAIRQKTPITLIVGSPISFDFEHGAGVLDVNHIIESIREKFEGDPTALSKLNALLAEADSSPYQKAFEYILSVRGAKFANEVIRSAVLNAYEGTVSTPIDENAMVDADWNLPPAVEALGKILSEIPASFGNQVITTNFDPLLEISIRRAGGSCYSNFFHRDGSPKTTIAEGIAVVHLHGYWLGSDTLHTPHQLKQNRPQLKSYLQTLFRNSLVVVVAYGGWDDVIGGAIQDVVLDDGSDPELLWAFKNTELSLLELSEQNLFNRLAPGIDRGRVQLYGGVDCHEVFPMLLKSLKISTADTINHRQGANSEVVDLKRSLSNEERLLANVVGMMTERRVDTAPRTDGFVGRVAEMEALNSADASVFCISGFGGQGKSILAANFLSDFNLESIKDWRDCREEGNTAHTALALFAERLTQGRCSANSLVKSSQTEIVETIVTAAEGRDGILVLDNIDTYVDLDQRRPTGIIGLLCDRLLETKTRLRVILTCRPLVQIPHTHFFGLPLSGLDEGAVRLLFSNKSGGYVLDSAECDSLMHLTDGHPLYISMLAAQRLSTGKALSSIFSEVEAAKSDVPAMILRSTFWLLKPEQMAVLRLLAELERPEHENALEEVTGQRYNKLAKVLKRLKDLNLVLERRDLSDKTLIDLHPLIRQFLRREYPQKDRDTFISKIILYFDKRIALVAKRVDVEGIPKNVLDVWTHKIEVLCNQANWNVAISELVKISGELEKAGLGEEFMRLGLKIFLGVDWLVAIDEAKDFRKLVNSVCHELSHHADHDEVHRWSKHYMDASGSRGADKLNVLEFTAFDAWLRKDYSVAAELANESVLLSKQIDINLPSSPQQTYALILRDSGDLAGAQNIFLEGLTITEALQEKNGKGPEFFGNIGRCLYLGGDLTKALQFFRRCGREMKASPRSIHNAGWLRFWVGEAMCKLDRFQEGYAFFCAAKLKWGDASRVLQNSVDTSILDLLSKYPELEASDIPEWQAEKIFNAWLLKNSD